MDCTSLSCARFELFVDLYFMLFIFLIYFSIHAISYVTKKKDFSMKAFEKTHLNPSEYIYLGSDVNVAITDAIAEVYRCI